MSKITLDNLSDNLKAYLEGLGLTEEQVLNLINENGLDEEELKAMLKDTMSINELNTNSKTVIGAINELFQNANNGKELIASAIGEPLDSNDTFSAMSNDINGLLSTFKTNMMNSGVIVESGDKFKELIEKIKGLTEGEGNKGVKYAEGECDVSVYDNASNVSSNYYYDPTNGVISYGTTLDFTPTAIFLCVPKLFWGFNDTQMVCNAVISSLYNNSSSKVATLGAYNRSTNGASAEGIVEAYITNVTNSTFKLYVLPHSGSYRGIKCKCQWYAIGVGEEDTTLRDSLASILQEEGVSVTEEDDMASLINKVDEEFTKDNNAKDRLYDLMVEGGYEVNSGMSMDDMLGMLELSGIRTSDIKQISVSKATNVNLMCAFIVKNDGSLWATGSNTNGQLGLGDTTNRASFTQVTTNINNDVKQVACGEAHTIILKNDGSVWGCGYDNGALGIFDGNSSSIPTRTTFTKVTNNVNNDVKQVFAGSSRSYIIKNDDSLWASGLNSNGMIGNSDGGHLFKFTQISDNVKHVACGYQHTVILKNDGSIWGCGNASAGQYGIENANSYYTTFTQATTNVNNDVKQVDCGEGHTIILKNDGSVWATGYNYSGELGLGDTTNRYTFTQVTTNVKQISCGLSHTIILKNDGSIWGCGWNRYGELTGNGGTNNKVITLTEITHGTGAIIKDVQCGWGVTFIVDENNKIWSCGDNSYGQLGIGNYNSKTIFTEVPRGL